MSYICLMKPISYTRNGYNVEFKYSLFDLKEKYKQSVICGSSGMFLVRINEKYKTFAYIEYDNKFTHYFYSTTYSQSILGIIEETMGVQPVLNTCDEFGLPIFDFKLLHLGDKSKKNDDIPTIRNRYIINKMTKQKRTTITLRFNETVDYSKLVKMAEQNNRSINSEILWAIQNRLKQFEIINDVKK